MSDIEVTIEPQFEANIVASVLPSLRNLRDDIKQDMLNIVPVGETGNLKRSIYADLDISNGDIDFGATEDYAYFVEVGHETESGTFVEAQPYVRPAAYKRRGDY